MEGFKALQELLLTFPVFPYLWIPHCIMMSLVARQMYEPSARDYARAHPLSCILRSFFYTYPGGILSSLLLSEPPLALLTNLPALTTMLFAWYLVYFSPHDIFARCILYTRITLPFSMAQDFLRLHLCLGGVAQIAKLYPDAFIYMVVFAVCKSSGFMVLKYLENALSAKSWPSFHVPNYPTKTCILASAVFAAQASGIYDFGGNGPILAGLTLFAISLRIFCYATDDPYQPIESLTCRVLFSPFNSSPSGFEAKDETKASKKVTVIGPQSQRRLLR